MAGPFGVYRYAGSGSGGDADRSGVVLVTNIILARFAMGCLFCTAHGLQTSGGALYGALTLNNLRFKFKTLTFI